MSFDRDRPDELRLAYVMTHYPRVALTFIAGEIDEVERQGCKVFPIVMNLPERAECTTDDERARQVASHYLKVAPLRLLSAFVALVMRHPLQTAKLVARALRSARFDLAQLGRRLAHLCYAAETARYCRRHGILQLHAHFGLAPATIAWFAADILNFRHHIGASWSFTIHGFQDFVDEAVARLDLKARSARFVICVSEFTRSQLCRVSDPRDWSRFHVVRCGIDLSEFPLRKSAPNNSRPRLIIVGRLSPEKGHVVLIHALKTLKDRGVEAEVEIVGDGPFVSMLKHHVAELRLEENVIFSGQMAPPRVREKLAGADIFCMASFSEGLPISLMEAMAIGVPAVSTWVSGIPELAIDNVTALTVPPGSSAALANAIERVIQDAPLRERLVVNARAKVEREYQRAQTVGDLVNHFRRNSIQNPSLEFPS